ncbi:Exostosin family isoform 1, putative [Babesia ovata]|uniref:Exostosin family isoform 1, putative n=1 Tax=Babesia ovata TaxID=189622 RepID=A0A2H6KDE5_9APIC|nr:Exostosin family isoform 1, putative [Babesia ovata]GBE61011.1 Exostosin family isoform 1, putative [Babesia ovata]
METTSMNLRQLFGLTVLIAILMETSSAQMNEKRSAYTLNDDVEVYVNGQRVTYQEFTRLKPPLDQHKFVVTSQFVVAKLLLLNSIIARYERPHVLKPYLIQVVEYIHRKFEEAKGEPFITFLPRETCIEYVQIFRVPFEDIKESPKFKYHTPAYFDIMAQYADQTKVVEKNVIDTLAMMCAQIYLQCSADLQKLEREKTVEDRRERRIVDTTTNIQASADVGSVNEATTVHDSKRDIGEHPSSMAANEMVATSYIQGSLGAWNPDTDGLSDNENDSGENAASSGDDGQRHRNSAAGRSSPADEDDWLDSYNNSEIAEEDGDADWDEYYEFFLKRLKRSPVEIGPAPVDEPSDPPSMWQRFLAFLCRIRWFWGRQRGR